MRSLRVSQLVLLTVILGCKLKSIHGVNKFDDENGHEKLEVEHHLNAKDNNLHLSHIIEQNLFNGQKRYQQWHLGIHVKPVHVASHSSEHRYKDEDITALNGHIEKNLQAGQLRYHQIQATKKQPKGVKKNKQKLHPKHTTTGITKQGTDELQDLIERNLMAGQLRYNEMKAREDDDEGVKHHTSNFRKTRKPPTPTQSTTSSSSTSSQTTLPKPIMAVGFPKAGTSSIFSFFQCSGLRSMHWYCCGEQTHPQFGGPQHMSDCMQRNLAQEFPILYRCGNYEVFAEINGPRKTIVNETGHTGVLLDDGTYDFDGPTNRIMLPQHHYLQEIHDEYPQATFILNTRPVDDWVKSVIHWKDDLAIQLANEYHAQSNGEIAIPSNQKEMKKFLSTIYKSHNAMIREFVSNHPSHALVEVDISDVDAGNVLGEAFGLDSSCWAHENKNIDEAMDVNAFDHAVSNIH